MVFSKLKDNIAVYVCRFKRYSLRKGGTIRSFTHNISRALDLLALRYIRASLKDAVSSSSGYIACRVAELSLHSLTKTKYTMSV